MRASRRGGRLLVAFWFMSCKENDSFRQLSGGYIIQKINRIVRIVEKATKLPGNLVLGHLKKHFQPKIF